MTESVYGPSAYAATMVAAPERGRLVYDIDVDVCVIGGGLAGLTAARELARYGWSVAVLEANRVAWNASGRNAGFVAPGFSERLERIVERVGLERTRALWILSAGGVDYVRTTIRETQMAGVSPVDGYLSVQRFDSEERLFAQAELIGEKLGTEVEPWSTEQVREVLKSPAYFQGLHLPSGFHIHPLNYALGLAAAAEEAGAKIFEQTRAVAIDPAGVRKRITTADGRVRAGHVVLAGSAHLEPLCPMISGSILPVASYVATTAALSERLTNAVTYPGAVSDTRRVGHYFRIVDGDRLLWGSRIAPRLAPARRLAKLVRRDIGNVFPQLGEVEITHAWSGVMGYAVHKMPLIGEVSPGLWVATAFGGHGLNTSAMAGELIARAIAHRDDRWRLFASYDLVYTGGGIGRAAAQVLSWSMRIRDAVDEQLAWRRAVSRRRKEAFAARAAEEAKRRLAEQAARLAAEEVERLAAAEVERAAALQAVERAAAEAYAADQEVERRAAEEAAFAAAHEAQRRAAEEAARQAALRAADEARRRAQAQASAGPAPEAGAETARSAIQPLAREAAERAGRIAAEEAAHRIAREARLAAKATEATDAARVPFAAPGSSPSAPPAEPEQSSASSRRPASGRSRRRSGQAAEAADPAPAPNARSTATAAEANVRAAEEAGAGAPPDSAEEPKRKRRRTVKSAAE